MKNNFEFDFSMNVALAPEHTTENESPEVEPEAETETPEFDEPECKEEEAKVNADKVFRKEIEKYPKILSLLAEYKNSPVKNLEVINSLEKEKASIELMAIEKINAYIISIIRARYSTIIDTSMHTETIGDEKIKVMSPHMEDMFSSAVTEILINLHKYNPKYAFTTFCKPHIWHAIKYYETHFITHKNSSYYNKNALKVIQARDELIKEGVKNPAIWEIADRAGMSSKVAANAIRNESAAERVSLDEVTDAWKPGQTPEDKILHNEEQEFIKKLLSNINDVEKYVILQKNGCLDGERHTFKEISVDPFFINLVKTVYPNIIPKMGLIKIKSQTANVLHLPETFIKKVEKDALAKIRLTDSFNQNKRNTISGETINVVNIEKLNVVINNIISEEIELPEIMPEDFS